MEEIIVCRIELCTNSCVCALCMDDGWIGWVDDIIQGFCDLSLSAFFFCKRAYGRAWSGNVRQAIKSDRFFDSPLLLYVCLLLRYLWRIGMDGLLFSRGRGGEIDRRQCEEKK